MNRLKGMLFGEIDRRGRRESEARLVWNDQFIGFSLKGRSNEQSKGIFVRACRVIAVGRFARHSTRPTHQIEIEDRLRSKQRRRFGMHGSTIEKVQVTFERRPKNANRLRMFQSFAIARTMKVARRIRTEDHGIRRRLIRYSIVEKIVLAFAQLDSGGYFHVESFAGDRLPVDGQMQMTFAVHDHLSDAVLRVDVHAIVACPSILGIVLVGRETRLKTDDVADHVRLFEW